MDLISLTVSEINGRTVSPATTYGVDVASIVEPISNNGVTSTVVVKIIDNIDSKASGLGNDIWEVSETLATIVGLSDHLFLCDVVSRRGETVSYQRVFYADRVVGGFAASGGVTYFYYAEDGDPNLVFYGVSQTVAQIVAQSSPSGTYWALNGNTVGSIKKLGTLDNFELPFIINSLEQARLTLSGLGVGTNAPAYKLDIDSLVSEATAIARFANTKINFRIFASDATPEGAITGDKGDICVVDNATNGQVYIKYTGTATNTGWTLVTNNDTVTTINSQADSYTLVLTDKNKLIHMTKATANDLTVPTNASVAFPIGTTILFDQYGAGQVTIVPAGGVTVRCSNTRTKTTTQYSVGSLLKIGTDEWLMSGDLTV